MTMTLPMIPPPDGGDGACGDRVTSAALLRGIAQSLMLVADELAEQAEEATTLARLSSDEVLATAHGARALVEGVELIAADARRQRNAVDTACASAQDGAAAMGALARSAGDISAIVTLITGIAKQTRHLAFNARIEAARAGDAGLGFAVVADEVKALSDQTADATADIGRMIGQVSDDVSDTLGLLGATVTGFSDAQSVSARVADASTAQRTAGNGVLDRATRSAELADRAAEAIGRLATGATMTAMLATQIGEAAAALDGPMTTGGARENQDV